MKKKINPGILVSIDTTKEKGFTSNNGRIRYGRSNRNITAFKDEHGNVSYNSSDKSWSVDLLGALVALLILLTVFRFLGDGDVQITFYGFLNMLSNVPTLDISFIASYIPEVNFPAWADFLEPLVNTLLNMARVTAYFGTSLWNALLYCFYFLRFLFGY